MYFILKAQLENVRTGMQKYSQYYSTPLLPPPPTAPMARPVTIIRSSGIPPENSNIPSVHLSIAESNIEHSNELEQKDTPSSLNSVMTASNSKTDNSESLSRAIVSAQNINREFSFTQFHSQSGQVRFSFFSS